MRLKDLDKYASTVRAQRINAQLREKVETLLRNEQGFRDIPDEQQLEILNSILGKHLRYNKEFRKDFKLRQRKFQKRFKK